MSQEQSGANSGEGRHIQKWGGGSYLVTVLELFYNPCYTSESDSPWADWTFQRFQVELAER